jgi:hypothetical protein
MKTLKQITLSLLLVAAISVSAAAQNGGCIPGDTNSPPCGCNPGDTNSPPCTGAAQMAADTEASATGITTTQVNSTTDVVSTVTMELVETLLSIF